jgi:hypothetical protein
MNIRKQFKSIFGAEAEIDQDLDARVGDFGVVN